MSGTIEINGQTYKVTLTAVPKKTNKLIGMNEPDLPPSRESTNSTMPSSEPFSEKSYNGSGGRSKSKKASKGTRKLSPYMKFAQEARKNIIAQNPELKSDIIAVGKKIGEQWRALSAEEKAKY